MGDSSPIITRYGERMCPCVVAMLPVWEDGLRKAGLIKRDLDGLVTQGGYNRGVVAASAGTHDGGGVLDLDNSLGTKALPILRRGAAAWWRTPAQSKLFPYHIHLVVVGCPHLSAGAAHQIEEYKKGRNGLAGRGPDDGPHVPITTWQQALAAWTKTQGDLTMADINTLIAKIDALAAQVKALSDAEAKRYSSMYTSERDRYSDLRHQITDQKKADK